MAVYSRNKSNEVLGLVILAMTLLLILALLSYNAFDPSLNVSTAERDYQNFIGRSGAWVSDVLFQIFGYPALLLPIPFLFIGYRKLRGSSLEYPYLKTLGFVLLVFSLSSGLTLLDPENLFITNFTPGGVIGMISARLLISLLDTTGTSILITSIFLLSLLLTTRFSIDQTLSWLANRNWTASSEIRERYQNWLRNRREHREAVKMRRSKKDVVARPMPKKIAFDAGPAQTDETASSSAPKEIPEATKPSERDDRVPVLQAQQKTPLTSDQRADQSPIVPGTKQSYQLPTLDFLQLPPDDDPINESELLERAEKLTKKCAEFDVLGRVLQIHPGPVVTTFEFKPDPGIKYSRITNLSDDLCLAMKAESVRIDRVPGKNTVGIEVPNRRRRVILLRELLGTAEFQRAESRLTLGLGQLINGGPFVADLARMPHLLIAGSTGSGKSVGLNCMVCSILYKACPSDVRFIMVDPKRLELGLYEDIPHLLTPIVTDPKKAANALAWAVREMEERYRLLAQHSVRNLAQYNSLVREGEITPSEKDEEEIEPLPNIVILVDELADLMMTAGKDVETAVTRLAQMARAVGIHLILATQRPSVDVITGLIKANFPSRISFRVSSKIDSRTILDTNGAEGLLGRGDMLFLSPETSRLTRIHGAYISEKEIARIVSFLKQQAEPDFREEILEGEDEEETGLIDVSDMEDKLYDDAARFVIESRKASTSLLQRRFRIGYGRAARLLDMMEHEGLVGPSEGSKPRDVLVPVDYFNEVDSSD